MADLVCMTPENVSLATRLEAASTALAGARDDFDRLRIRDAAAAVQAAAEVIGRREVQVLAAELVADAERAIAQANPPARLKRKADVALKATSPIPKDQLSKMRRAHSQSDEEYEAVKAERRDAGEPVTRQALIERNREAARQAKTADREQRREEAAAAAADNPLPPNLHVCEIAALRRHVAPRSVDAIVTDPPYLTEFVERGVYRDLAIFASYALRPGGLLLAIAPHLHLERVLREAREAGLDYRWAVAYFMPSARQAIHGAKVTCKWKPWLAWTQPGGALPDRRSMDAFYLDHYGAEAKTSTDAHVWGQTKSGIKGVIEEWVPEPGSVICDPFCGAGSTLEAALEIDRGYKVLGADVDAASVEITRRKLARLSGATWEASDD